MLSTGETAKRIGISINTVKSWVDKGFIKYTQKTPTGRMLFDEDYVTEFVGNLTNKTNQEEGDKQ